MSDAEVAEQNASFVRDALASAKYRYSDRTREDMLEVSANCRGLRPVTETHVYNDGTEQLLLALAGTIPIQHKGSIYNIPIAIWLLDTHPYNAPMVFVKPTPDMRIKVSDYVHHDGKVSLPYLQEWKPGSSELLLLIQVLIITFQDDPPVYSVQVTTPPYPSVGSPPNVPYNSQAYSYPATGIPRTSSVSPIRRGFLSVAEEKLRERLEAIHRNTEAERQAGIRLQNGTERLSMMMTRVEDEKLILQENLNICQNEVSQLDKKIIGTQKEVENREATIEESVQAPKPLYKQIVNAYAEEAALDDGIYFVSEGFRSGKMDLDQFEKSIRKLARKQFMVRLLLHKCREKAGLSS